MISLLLVPVAVVYFVITAILFFYGINLLYLAYLAFRVGPNPHRALPKLSCWPRVTVQLPIYNEMYVAKRLVDAAAKLDYPKHLLEIQVLDDSTDNTVNIVQQAARQARARGINIKYLHRVQRAGYKAGALNEGLNQARGEFIAIFDADFLPPPDFLKRSIPQFKDPRIAFVQARWTHLNREFSILTLLQAFSIDAHFMVEQLARSHAGIWFNFNGTAGIWRKAAISDAGGWRAETLSEDMDLSYRAFLKGWKAAYLSDLEAPAELPIAFAAFRRQQHRWARGSLECAIQLLPQVWASDFPLRAKILATFHLCGYLVHLLLFAYTLIFPLVILLSVHFPALISLFGLGYLFILTSLAPTILFIVAQHNLRRKWWRLLPFLLLISGFGAGMMLNTVRAAWEIVNRKPAEFKRTPKFGVLEKTRDWEKRKYQLKLDPIVYWELAFALLNGVTILIGVHEGYWFTALYAGLFAFGLGFASIYTIVQTLQIQRMQLSSSLARP